MKLLSKSSLMTITYHLEVDNQEVIHTEYLKENGELNDSETKWADNGVVVDEGTKEEVEGFVDGLPENSTGK